MKLLIIAQSPGSRKIPPPTRALQDSGSLQNLLRLSGLKDAEMLYQRASVVNLIPWYLEPNQWPSQAAKRRARSILDTLDISEYTHITTLGGRARLAFSTVAELPKNDWFVWHSWKNYWIAFSPHPSGLSREWNDAITRVHGGEFWRKTMRDAAGVGNVRAPGARPRIG